jgi:hypothetical protein
MVDQIAASQRRADGAAFESDPERFRKLAAAALKPSGRTTEAEAVVDAAYEVVGSDAYAIGIPSFFWQVAEVDCVHGFTNLQSMDIVFRNFRGDKNGY